MGRALAFADPDIIRMAREDYVPVTGDDWYQRRRQDAEGEFFRKVADQGPRKGEGGATRQGIYLFTADGKLLAYRNAGQNPGVMRDVLKQGLAAWRKLPQAQRKPGAVPVDEPDKVDPRYSRTPPPGGLIVTVFTRILDRSGKGDYVKGTCSFAGGDQPARDHLWLTEPEWKSLVPAEPKPGDKFPMPARIAERMLRFHLIDNTRGEPPLWRREEIRKSEMTLTVEEVTADNIRLRMDGAALLATDADPAKASRGFDASLRGVLDYNRGKKVFDRWDVVAVGDHWGEGPFTRNARPGKAPLGIAFELSKGTSAADLVPPQGAREIGAYFGTGR